MRRTMALAALLATLSLSESISPAPAHAAEAASAEDRIRELERRVAELESALRQASAAEFAELRRRLDLLARELEAERIGEAARPRELKSLHGLGPAASKVYGEDRGVSVGGYGEALFQDFDARQDDGARTGRDSVSDFLRAVLYFGYKFNDRVVFNSEIEYEHATTGEGAEEQGEVSVEFATLDFLLHPAANVRAGLVLMPVGFLNELHESPIFLGARRPDVETRVIPSTWRETGLGLFGDIGPFSYRAYLVNGFDAEGFTASSGLRDGRQSGSEASARDTAFTARADFQGVPGLLAGASFYSGESGQGAEDINGDVIGGQVTLYDLHAEYSFRGIQLRGLWSSADIQDAAEIGSLTAQTVGSRITGWYAQGGYDVLSPLGERTGQSLIPFVRYERYDTQDRVPHGAVTNGANDVKVVTFGAAYKPLTNVSIKVDFQDYDRGDGSGTDQINAALGYLF